MITLDQSQRKFCELQSDNIRLLAPAGCGKTSSLLYRCRALAERSEKQQRFLLLSFTNAAAAEMQDRLSGDPEFENIRSVASITTLNSWGWNRLRNHHGAAKLIVDNKWCYRAVKNHLNSIVSEYTNLQRSTRRQHRRFQPRDLMDVVDSMKSLGFDHIRHTNFEKFEGHINFLKEMGLEVLMDEQFYILIGNGVIESENDEEQPSTKLRNRDQFYRNFFAFWRKAVKRLHEDLIFTYEDQKYWNYLNLINARPVPAPTRYHHVMVDEFQDINPLDLKLINLIVKVNQATLTIVGDDDQAIFEWRGASPEFILNPEKHFKREFTTHILQINYRSPRNIVQYSQKLIAHNKRRVLKKVSSSLSNTDAKIEVVKKDDIADELDFVTKIVQETEPGRVAVIAKSRAQLIPYEIHFASNEVNFETATDLNLFCSDTLQNIAKILLVRDNKDRPDAIHNNVENTVVMCDLICRFPLNWGLRQDVESFLSSRTPATVRESVEVICDYPDEIQKRGAKSIYSSAMEFLNANTTPEALRCLAKFDGLTFNPLKAQTEIFFTAPPLEQLATLMEKRGWTASKLEHMIQKAKSRIQEFNMKMGDGASVDSINQRPLHLMTATRSKGKEFETVIILSVLKDVWPHKKAETEEKIEAERRLFYVAFTRAKKHIIMLNGPKELPLSPFVNELGLPS